MELQPLSSSGVGELDDAALAVLVACHHRGPLSLDELSRLMEDVPTIGADSSDLLSRGFLTSQRGRFAITRIGREYIEGVLDAIEASLTPDAPAYVERFRRRSPSLPFETTTVWAEAVALNIRVDPTVLRPLVPATFDLDLYDGSAFVSVTVSRLKDFGLGRIPGMLRLNFYQATYRAHVTYTDFRGRTSRGCYFVRSETNSRLMSLAANLLPEFRAHHCSTSSILMLRRAQHLVVTVDSADDPAGQVVIVLDTAKPKSTMPLSSAFPSIQAASDFLVNFHTAFSFEPETNEVYLLEIDRGDWHIRVVEALDYYMGYFVRGPFDTSCSKLDSVFYFTDVPYRWLPLVKERVRQTTADAFKAGL